MYEMLMMTPGIGTTDLPRFEPFFFERRKKLICNIFAASLEILKVDCCRNASTIAQGMNFFCHSWKPRDQALTREKKRLLTITRCLVDTLIATKDGGLVGFELLLDLATKNAELRAILVDAGVFRLGMEICSVESMKGSEHNGKARIFLLFKESDYRARQLTPLTGCGHRGSFAIPVFFLAKPSDPLAAISC